MDAIENSINFIRLALYNGQSGFKNAILFAIQRVSTHLNLHPLAS